jgi:hypothetical protein
MLRRRRPISMLAAALLAFVARTARAEFPPDAPRTVVVERAQLLTPEGEWLYLDGGVYQNSAAAQNTARRIVELESQRDDTQTIAIGIAVTFVLGFAAGFAAAKLAR